MRRSSQRETSRVNRVTAAAQTTDVFAYRRDLERWPQSWMGLDQDLPPGEALVVCLRPCIEHLAGSGLSPKTIRRHVDHLTTFGYWAAKSSAIYTKTHH